MSDNIQVNLPESAGKILATKEDSSGNQHEKVLTEYADVSGEPVVVSATTPLPVTISQDIEIGAVELKDGVSNTRATVKTDGTDNALVVMQNSAPLPTGAATSTIQTDGTQKTQLVDAGGDAVTVTGGKLDVNASIDTTGLATSSKQDTGNASLASIDAGIPAALGQATMANSMPVVISSNQSSIPVTTTITDTSPATQNITTRDLASVTNTGANSQSFVTGTPTAGSAASFSLSGIENIDVQVSGTWTGTLQAEISMDGGTIWFLRGVHQFGSSYTATSFTSAFGGLLNAAGLTNFRIRATAAMTGTAIVLITESVNSQSVYVANTIKLSDPTTPTQQLAISSVGGAKIDTVIPGTAATNLGKAEDAPHTTGDVGVMALAVRNDSGSILAGNDGDYIPLTTDNTGALRVDINGTASTSNSSTATLLANAVFTGTSEDVLNFNEIRITVYSDVASATNGLSIQQSTDNSNWIITDTYTIAAATGKTFSVPRQARYFRVVYTNGASNQATFILQTILNRTGTKSSSQRPSDAYTNETDLEQQQSFGMGYDNATGLWNRLRSSTGFGLEVDVKRAPGSATDNTTLYSGTISATGAGTGVDTTGYASIILQLSGTWNGNLIVEGSTDNATWVQMLVMSVNEVAMQDVINDNGIYVAQTTCKYVRLNTQQLTSGSITALLVGRTVNSINAADRLSLAMDKNTNTPLYVSETGNKKDLNNALIPSDAPTPIYGFAAGTSSILFQVDTTGYQSAVIQVVTFGSFITVQSSNDGITWSNVLSYTQNSSSYGNITTSGMWEAPVVGKFMRGLMGGAVFTNCLVYLRQRPFSPIAGSIGAGVNIQSIGGVAAAASQSTGTLAVGGLVNSGNVVTNGTFPLVIAGADGTTNSTPTTIRRILTDTSGRIIGASTDQSGTARAINSISPAASVLNVSSLAVTDTTQFEGQSQIELLAQILLELKINNQMMSELPLVLQGQDGRFNEPNEFRNDVTMFAI